jgi:hypothetical protein
MSNWAPPRATHTESRTRTETAGRYLQVLGIVLPIMRNDAGYPTEALRQIDAHLAIADLLLRQRVDRHRQVEWLLRRARGRYDGGGQNPGVAGWVGDSGAGDEQKEYGDKGCRAALDRKHSYNTSLASLTRHYNPAQSQPGNFTADLSVGVLRGCEQCQ